MSDRVGDQAEADFVALTGSQTVGHASSIGAAAWYVVTTEQGAPEGVLALDQIQALPDELTLKEAIRERAPLLTMAAEASIEEAGRSRALRQLGHESSGAVVTDGDEIVGVLGRGTLDAILEDTSFDKGTADLALEGGGGGSATDWMSAGVITGKVKIVRICGFEEGTVICDACHEFPERPDSDQLPWCENPRGLAKHKFAWRD